MAVDLDSKLDGNLAVIAQQGVADNQRLAQNTLLAYQKDLFQGGQAEVSNLLAALNAVDRTPVVKAIPS
jgi:hypothetical protein